MWFSSADESLTILDGLSDIFTNLPGVFANLDGLLGLVLDTTEVDEVLEVFSLLLVLKSHEPWLDTDLEVIFIVAVSIEASVLAWISWVVSLWAIGVLHGAHDWVVEGVQVHEHHWHTLEVNIDASLSTGGIAVIVERGAAVGQVSSDGDTSTVLDDATKMDAAGIGLG